MGWEEFVGKCKIFVDMETVWLWTTRGMNDGNIEEQAFWGDSDLFEKVYPASLKETDERRSIVHIWKASSRDFTAPDGKLDCCIELLLWVMSLKVLYL